jgi:BlaI family transcriptional regulator, penicillinase repressor
MRHPSRLLCDSCRATAATAATTKMPPPAIRKTPNRTPGKTARKTAEHLTRREREIVNALFALGNRASAEEIRARLTSPPSDSSVRVMLARLERKGALKHQQDGIRFIYSATTSPAVAKRTALQQYLQTFFGGSLRQMMTAFVREASWSDEDLAALRAEIDRVRKERKRT